MNIYKNLSYFVYQQAQLLTESSLRATSQMKGHIWTPYPNIPQVLQFPLALPGMCVARTGAILQYHIRHLNILQCWRQGKEEAVLWVAMAEIYYKASLIKGKQVQFCAGLPRYKNLGVEFFWTGFPFV